MTVSLRGMDINGRPRTEGQAGGESGVRREM